jgi:hypothetical protein
MFRNNRSSKNKWTVPPYKSLDCATAGPQSQIIAEPIWSGQTTNCKASQTIRWTHQRHESLKPRNYASKIQAAKG